MTNTSSKDHYIETLYAAETAEMAETRKRIHADHFPIHISAIEGKLLHTLIKAAKIKTCVEVGTLGGYSSLWLARALGDDGHLWTCEQDEKRLSLAKETLASHENVTLIAGDAKKTLPPLGEKHGPFDMIFIDADKKSYLHYLDWADQYIRPGGLIIADDTLLKGAVYLEELPYRIRKTTKDTLIEFNARLADTTQYDSILWPTDAGLTIAVKK